MIGYQGTDMCFTTRLSLTILFLKPWKLKPFTLNVKFQRYQGYWNFSTTMTTTTTTPLFWHPCIL